MIGGLQLAITGGALIGLGAAGLVRWVLPDEPDLADALERLSPDAARHHTQALAAPAGRRERLGLWAARTLPAVVWVGTPRTELALLRVSLPRFYAEKLTFALLGLVTPPLLTVLFAGLGLELPVPVPIAATIGLGVGLFFLPNYNARDDARRARVEFARALGAYVDLVALERNAGSGSRQALEMAANVGDTWVFQRLSEELARSRWSGQAPWDALHALADELGLPDLRDVADIMRLSGEEGAQVYATLRARSSGIRSALLAGELAQANEVGERLSIPMSLLGVIFMAILLAPALLRILLP